MSLGTGSGRCPRGRTRPDPTSVGWLQRVPVELPSAGRVAEDRSNDGVLCVPVGGALNQISSAPPLCLSSNVLAGALAVTGGLPRLLTPDDGRYDECHPGQFKGKDTSYVLAFSTIMLATSLHNPNVRNRVCDRPPQLLLHRVQASAAVAPISQFVTFAAANAGDIQGDEPRPRRWAGPPGRLPGGAKPTNRTFSAKSSFGFFIF